MHIDRRTLLAAVGCLAALPARAQLAPLTLLSDGYIPVGLDRLAANPEEPAVKAALLAAGIAPPVRFSINVPLLAVGSKRVLVDAGAGGTWVDTAGKLGDDLGAKAIDPKSVDLVVFTHAHPDHLWGVIDDFDDSLRFPNATYVIPDAEFLFWMTPGEAERQRAADGVTAGARRVLKRLEPKLARIKAGQDVLPGLTYLDAAGHTPGQCAVWFQASASAAVLIAADTIFHPVVSVQYPDWQPAQDMDGARASKSRRDLLALAADKRATLTAYHVAAPGVGRVERKGAGFVWAP